MCMSMRCCLQGFYLDELTKHLLLELTTYNRVSNVFGSMKIEIDFEQARNCAGLHLGCTSRGIGAWLVLQ